MKVVARVFVELYRFIFNMIFLWSKLHFPRSEIMTFSSILWRSFPLFRGHHERRFLVASNRVEKMQFGENFDAIDNSPSGIIDFTSFSMSWHLHSRSMYSWVDFSYSCTPIANTSYIGKRGDGARDYYAA